MANCVLRALCTLTSPSFSSPLVSHVSRDRKWWRWYSWREWWLSWWRTWEELNESRHRRIVTKLQKQNSKHKVRVWRKQMLYCMFGSNLSEHKRLSILTRHSEQFWILHCCNHVVDKPFSSLNANLLLYSLYYSKINRFHILNGIWLGSVTHLKVCPTIFNKCL